MSPTELIKIAFKAMGQAYAPYSNYKVGAALLCEDGTTFDGCNVENNAYGLTNCAERTAVFSAVANGQRKMKAIAIVAGEEAIPFPCGACRQVLAEFCGPEFQVYVASAAEPTGYIATTLGELLPQSFSLNKDTDQ